MAESSEDRDGCTQALKAEAERIAKLLGLDAVQILASTTDGEGQTISHQAGFGDWYARRGLVMEFDEVARARNMEYGRRTWSIDDDED